MLALGPDLATLGRGAVRAGRRASYDLQVHRDQLREDDADQEGPAEIHRLADAAMPVSVSVSVPVPVCLCVSVTHGPSMVRFLWIDTPAIVR